MPDLPQTLRNTEHATRFSLLKPDLILALLILTYAAYFSWYTINRHNTLNSYAADLSLIDQPMWNTVKGPGGFMELTWGDHQQPRLAEHFEPILIPLALLFFLWDDVRILLIAQSVALALGALPVFWIARKQLAIINEQLAMSNEPFAIRHSPFANPHSPFAIRHSPTPSWAALAFVVAYLLSPHLQAANIADFHADPFVVTPLLLAFWYGSQKRWGWMWLWATVAMATKETLPTLTAMLGVWLLVKGYVQSRKKRGPAGWRWPAVLPETETRPGLGLIFGSTAWFLIATFLIVAPLARQYFGTDGPIYLASRYGGGLAGLPALLQEPARWQYLAGLLAAVGFLPLLAPELLILGLPLLVANLTSNFPGQYSGEQHYSAPLVVAFIIAAIYGTGRLLNKLSLPQKNSRTPKRTILPAILLWLLIWSFGYHALHGWTPLSTRMETYETSPASSRLPALAAPIPAEAVVSASAAIHPHLAHRRVIYLFPTVQDATYALIDVTDIPGTHPNDARTRILEMLEGDWRLVEADQGLLLAHRAATNSPSADFPDSFFDFARAVTAPTHPAPLTFGDGRLHLLGYDLYDDPDDGVSFRFYWQATDRLPPELRLWPLVYDDLGRLLNDPTQAPMIAAVWYPPDQWRPGEAIVTETLPQRLPEIFHLGLAVGPENSFYEPERWFPVTTREPDLTTRQYSDRWLQLGTFKRQGSFLADLPATSSLRPLTPAGVRFGPVITLTGYWFGEDRFQPAGTLPVLLQWTASAPPQADVVVFVHLLDPDGRLVSQSDGPPTWLTPMPTWQWSPSQPIPDHRFLALPEELPPGSYTLQVGLYHPQTLERLPLPDGTNVFILEQIEVR